VTKEEVKKYLLENELDIQRANAALLVCDLVYASYSEADKFIGTIYSPVFVYLSARSFNAHTQIIAKEIVIRAETDLYQEYSQNSTTLEKKMAEHLFLEQEIDAIWNKYQGLSSEKMRGLPSLYSQFIEVSMKWWAYAAVLDSKGLIIGSEIIPKFAKRHGLALPEAAEVFATLSHPENPTILNNEHALYLEICADLYDNKNPEQKIKQYLRDFFWIKSNFYKAVHLTVEGLRKMAKKDLEKRGIRTIRKEMTDIKSSFKKIHAKKAELKIKLELTDEDKKDINFAEKVILWVDRRKFGMMRDFYYQLVIMEDVAEECKIDYNDIALYTVQEFGTLLKENKRLGVDEITKRAGGVMIKWQKGEGRQMFYGPEGKELYEVATAFSLEQSIKGYVASTGGENKIIGKVRVIFKPNTQSFETGEILVTSMTRVEFVPLMRKAKAIITDEGGIACHAAIVSRELGIPAIIGTKISTKTLKTGDVVEMDLKSGVVKLIV